MIKKSDCLYLIIYHGLTYKILNLIKVALNLKLLFFIYILSVAVHLMKYAKTLTYKNIIIPCYVTTLFLEMSRI